MADILNKNPEITPHDQEINLPQGEKPEQEHTPETQAPVEPVETPTAVPQEAPAPTTIASPEIVATQPEAAPIDEEALTEEIKNDLYKPASELDPSEAVDNLLELINPKNSQQ